MIHIVITFITRPEGQAQGETVRERLRLCGTKHNIIEHELQE